MQSDPLNSDQAGNSNDDRISALRATMLLLAFGVAVMGYLMAIGHPDWFTLRPVSSASAAMSEASDHRDADHEDNA